MEAQTILIAGATGAVGKHLAGQLAANYRLTLLTRNQAKLHSGFSLDNMPSQNASDTAALPGIVRADVLQPSTLHGICEGIDIVISTVGASLNLRAMNDKNSFMEVDADGNRNLLEEAKKAGVRRFVYLSAFGAENMSTAYTNAHEAFVRHLKASGLEYAVVRPTGFFYVNLEFVAMAKSGLATVIGNGNARTNPIHEADVAKACAEAALGQSNMEVNIGGPETFTRKEIAELAFAILQKKPRVLHIPAVMPRLIQSIITPFNRRVGDLVEFLGYVATNECIAPVYGEKRLGEYFSDNIRASGA